MTFHSFSVDGREATRGANHVPVNPNLRVLRSAVFEASSYSLVFACSAPNQLSRLSSFLMAFDGVDRAFSSGTSMLSEYICTITLAAVEMNLVASFVAERRTSLGF